MKFKKLLAAGLALAMSLTAMAGLAACGDKTTPPEENPPEEQHEHTFDTTKWESNETTHWHPATCDHTDQKGDIARHTFDNRECTVCHYKQAAEVYLVGMIASQPGSNFAEYFIQSGNSVTEIRKNCIKMELAEDGETYEAEVLLKKTDRFRVYEYSSKVSYPNAVESATGLGVEADNGYIVSWKLDDARPTWRVHDHDFTKYDHDAQNHWKVCSLDGTVEPDVEKEAHDFSNGNCVCGQVAPEECQHPNGYSFAYTELPAAEANGGELQKTCPDCADTESVSYKKGFGTEANATTGPTNSNLLTEAGTYYFRGCNGFRFETTTAGTYTIRFAGKLIPTTDDVSLYAFHIGSSYAAALASTFSAIGAGKSSTKYNDEISKYNVQISGYESDQYKQFESLTFTVKDSDVAAGAKVCVQILFREKSNLVGVNRYGYLISIECPQAASVSAAQEYALPVSTGKNGL